MSKAALKNYGNLGCLIQLKLYALILQYLSNESLEEVKHSDDWDTIEQETDPAMLWDVIESTHKINTISQVESVLRYTCSDGIS